MKLEIKAKWDAKTREAAVAVGVFEGAKKPTGAAAEIDLRTGGMVSDVIKNGDFKGKLYQIAMLYAPKGNPVRRVVVVGLGKEKEMTLERLRGAGAKAARHIRGIGLESMAFPSDFAAIKKSPIQDRAGAIVEGALLGLYSFDEYKASRNGNGKKPVKRLILLVEPGGSRDPVRHAVRKAEKIARAVYTARDLVSHPSNRATPSYLARTARSIARQCGLKCRVIDARAAEKLGMGAFLSVAKGSDEPAKFLILEHSPRSRRSKDTVILVGKAITFDSGGISLKPASNMEEMKTDMSGGAAVIGALQAAALLKIPLHVVGLVPATENLPSGHALKPGDVVRAMAGKTIEIISTDAEGRLVLADALHYAQRYRPAAVVDLATLTGACVIALGNEVAGMMGTQEGLIEKLRRAGEKTGERVWPLPLYEAYSELIKSDIADLKNAGGRSAGTITAGCFLKEFAGETPWAHIDIAGTAWTKKDRPTTPKGATGFGVRLLVELLEGWA